MGKGPAREGRWEGTLRPEWAVAAARRREVLRELQRHLGHCRFRLTSRFWIVIATCRGGDSRSCRSVWSLGLVPGIPGAGKMVDEAGPQGRWPSAGAQGHPAEPQRGENATAHPLTLTATTTPDPVTGTEKSTSARGWSSVPNPCVPGP